MEPSSVFAIDRRARKAGLLGAILAFALLLGGCGESKKKPTAPTPTQTTGVAGVPATTPGAGKTPVAAAHTPAPTVGSRPVAMPTPAMQFDPVDVAFIPLNDKSNGGFYLCWECRHYARVAIQALIAPHLSCTIADDFAVEHGMWAGNVKLWEPLPPARVVELGRTYNARFAVHPFIKDADNKSIEATLTVYDVATGQPIGSKTVRGKPKQVWPMEAQRILLEASFETASILARALGKEVTIPATGAPTPPGSQSVLEDADKSMQKWTLDAVEEALDMAGIAIKNGPADGRAWAMAARCYARLALDTAEQPARFHRECRLRAGVAADIATKFAPEDEDVRFAEAFALYANRRRTRAEKRLIPFENSPEYAPAARAILMAIRYGGVRREDYLSTNPLVSDSDRCLALRTNLAYGFTEEAIAGFSQMLGEHPEDVILSHRYERALHKLGGTHNRVASGAHFTLHTLHQALLDLLPEVWQSGPVGRGIAADVLGQLGRDLLTSVPTSLQTPSDLVELDKALETIPRYLDNEAILNGIVQGGRKNLLFRVVRIYGRLRSATLRHFTEHPPLTGRPLALSLCDRIRFYDRLIVDGLYMMRYAYGNWGVYDTMEIFIPEVARNFPDDESAQGFVARYYHDGSNEFRPPLVTRYWDQAHYAWADYPPEVLTRADWAVSRRKPEQFLRQFRIARLYDRFNPDHVALIASRLYYHRQWEEAGEFYKQAIKADPHRVDLRTKQLYLERARTGRQITKADIEKLADDFRDRPEIEQTLLDIYYEAGLVDEVETICRKFLAGDPGHYTAYRYLVHVLRFKGRQDECDKILPPYLKRHRTLAGNWAAIKTAEHYFKRREYDKMARTIRQYGAALDTWQGDTIFNLGNLKWAQDDYEGARAEYERLFKRYGGSAGPTAIANMEALRGNWDEMLKQADRILAVRPADKIGAWLKSLYFLHKGDLAEGEKYVLKARVMLQHSANAYQILGNWRFYAGNFKGAVEACQEGRKFIDGPYHEMLDVTECRGRLALGDTAGVEPIVKRMKVFSPLSMWPNLCEALWRLERGEPAQARDAIEKNLGYNPKDTHTQVALGRILMAEKKTDEAIRELRSAVAHVHDAHHLTEAYYHLAKALEAAGKGPEAREAWNSLLELWPQGWWAEEAKKGIQRVSKM